MDSDEVGFSLKILFGRIARTGGLSANFIALVLFLLVCLASFWQINPLKLDPFKGLLLSIVAEGISLFCQSIAKAFVTELHMYDLSRSIPRKK